MVWASFQVPKARCLASKVDRLLHTASTPLPRQRLFPAPPLYVICKPGLPVDTASEDPGLC